MSNRTIDELLRVMRSCEPPWAKYRGGQLKVVDDDWFTDPTQAYVIADKPQAIRECDALLEWWPQSGDALPVRTKFPLVICSRTFHDAFVSMQPSSVQGTPDEIAALITWMSETKESP